VSTITETNKHAGMTLKAM